MPIRRNKRILQGSANDLLPTVRQNARAIACRTFMQDEFLFYLNVHGAFLHIWGWDQTMSQCSGTKDCQLPTMPFERAGTRLAGQVQLAVRGIRREEVVNGG